MKLTTVEREPSVWQFNFFGGLRASNQERVVERFRTQKTAALVALLALRGGRSREDICALLWPDAAPEASRNSLSAALSALRRDLGEDIVRADRTSVSLAPSLYQTDVALFNEALKAGELARAVELYRGHLLPGFHEDPFPSLEREYEEKARAAFKTRLEELEENGQSTELLELARRAIPLFGDDERWFLALMRGHYGLGDLDAALRAYDSLGRFMRKNGDTASESARVLAKLIRRDKEREAIAAPVAPPARRPAATPQPVVPPRPFPSPPPPSLPLEDEANDWDDEAETTRNNLPTQWTRFFGREDERSLLRTWLLDGQKMVTLSGAGGSGKTRLALETLRELASDWEGDILYVPLAPLSDPDLILPAVRDALHLAGTPDLSPLEQIERTLRGRRALLFLDNFEQLVEGGAARLQSLRERLPQTTFLVTSRVLLQLPGEREFPVAPLPTPLRNTAPARVRECASAALFCDRSGLVIDASNAESVGALCRRLDGIPLALELAAARAKVLSPAQILERLQKHPDFLQSRELGVPARHKTLRATIEWSTDLLPPDLREFWTRLSLFHGGWTLDAAEKIAAPGICEDWETLDWLTLLRECSLIFTEESGDSSRFRMLQTLREFGREQLQHSAQVEHAFFDFYLGLAQQAASAMQGPGQTAWLARLDAEQDNLRAALTYARDSEPERGLLLATSLIDFWETRLSLDEGRGWIETFLKATATRVEKPATPAPKAVPIAPISSTPPVASVQSTLTTARVRALSGAGRLASHSIELDESRTLVEQGLEVARQSGDVGNLVYAISSFVRFAMTTGEVETDMRRARELADEGVSLARATGDKALLVEALAASNYIRISLIQFEGLRASFQESITLARELKDEVLLSRLLSGLAHLAYHEKNWDEANALLDESTPRARRSTSPWELLEALWVRTQVARESGRLDIARAAITEEWEICRDNPSLLWARSLIMMTVAYSCLREGDAVSAVRILGAEEVTRAQSGFQMAPLVRLDYNRYRDEALRVLGQSHFDALWAEGSTLPPVPTVDAALYSGDSRDTDASALTAARARALSGAGRLAFYASDLTDAEDLLRQGLDEARRSGDSSVLIDATRSSALATTAFGDAARARDLGRESVRLAREAGDNELLLKSLLDLGFAEVNVSDFLACEKVCLEAIALARREGKERSLAIALSTLAIAYNYLHRYDEALALAAESREVSRRQSATLELIVSSALFGHISSIQGQHAIARAAYRESIELTREAFPDTWTSVNVLLSAAYSFFRRGDARGCTLIMGACEVLAQAIDYQLMPFLLPDYEHFRSQARQILGAAEFGRVWNDARSLSTEQLIDFILEDDGAESPLPDPTTLSTRSLALSGAGRLAWYDGDFEASRTLASQSLEAARKSGDTASFVHAVAAFVRLSSVSGDIGGDIQQGRILSEEAVRLSRVAHDDSLLVESLISLTYANMIAGQLAGVEAFLDEAVSLARQLGDELQLATALVSQATLDYYEGRYAKARQLLVESTAINRRLNSPFGLFASLWCESHAAREEGDLDAAQSAVIEVLELCRDNSALHWNVFNAVLSAGFLLVRRGDVSGGVEVMSAADTLSEQVGYKWVPLLRPELDRYVAESRQILGDAAFANAWEAGKKQTLFRVIDTVTERLTRSASADPQLAARARALSGAGRLAWYASDMEKAGSLLRQGLDAARQIGDTPGIVYATRGLMRTLAVEGESAQASQLAHESLELARSSGDSALLIKALLDQGFADLNSADVVSALARGTEATALARQLGDESSLSLALNISAIALAHSNRDQEALDVINQSEEVARRVGSLWDVQVLLANKGRVLSRLGQHAAAQAAFNEFFALCRESFAESWSATNTFYALSYCFIRRGDVRDGVQLMGAAEAMRRRIGYELMPLMLPDHEEAWATARQALDEVERDSLLRGGAAMTLDEVFDFAIRSVPELGSVTFPGGSDEVRAARARALSGAGRLAWYASDMKQASAFLEQGLNASREIGDTEGIVYATRGLTRTAAATGDSAKSRHVAREALELARASGDSALLIKALLDQAFADINVGELDAATSLTSEAIGLARQIGDETALSLALNIGAIALSYRDRDEEALIYTRQSEEVARRIGSVWDLLVVLSLKGHSLSRLEQHSAAQEAFNESLSLCRESFSESWTVANCLIATSYSFLRRGEVSDGTQVLGAAEAMRERIGYELMPVMVPDYEKFVALARQTLGEVEFAAAKQRGASMTPSEIFDFAIRPVSPTTTQSGAIAPADELAIARSRALSGAGRLAWHDSDIQASRTLVDEGLEAARQSGDLASFVYAVAAFVRASMVTQESEGLIAQARLLSYEAVERSRHAGDKSLLLDSLISLGYATCILQQMQESATANEEAIALARELGDDANLGRSLTTQAGVYYYLGNTAPALVLLEECVEISRRLNSPWDIIAALWLLSGVLRQRGQLEDSYAAIVEVFEICRANPSYRWNVAHVLMMASYLFVEGGDASCAVQLMAASESLSEALGYHPTPNLLPEYEGYKAKAHALLGESAFEQAWEEGRILTPEEAIQLALAQGPQFLSKNTASSSIATNGVLAARSRALSGAARLASQGSDTESSRILVEQALEAARQSGDTASFVSAVSAYVRFSMTTGDSQGVISRSRLLGAEAVELARLENDKALLLEALIFFGYATCMLSRFKESHAASEEAVRLARELGDDTNLVRALNNQVHIYYHQSIYLPARIILEETEELSRLLGSTADLISSLWGLSTVAREQDELDVAEAAMTEILEICRANPSFRWGISNILVSASYLFLKRGEPTDAVLLMAAANALDSSLGYRTIPVLLIDFERYKGQALEMLGQVPFDIAWQEGRRLDTDSAIELALQLSRPPSNPEPNSPTSKTLSDEVLAARSRALSGAGRLAWHNNDLESSGRLVQEGLDAARESGDLASFVYAVAAYVRFAMVTGDITGLIANSRLLSEEAVSRSRRAGDKALLLDSLISLGYSTSIVSLFRESYTANEEAIALARELGDETSLVRVLNNQGTVYYCQGMYAPARMVLEESEQTCRRLNSTWDLIAARWTLSSVAREQGDLDLAADSISEVLRIYRSNPSILWGGTNVLLTASYLFVRHGDARTAVRLMSAAESILETLGYHLVPVLATDYERYRTQARQMITETDFASAWEEGHLLTPEAAIDLALQH